MNKQAEINYYFKKCDYLKDQIVLLNAEYHDNLRLLESLCKESNMNFISEEK